MIIKRINYYQVNPSAINALASANKHITSIDKKLRALIELRVSQINGCSYCVDMHSQQARAEGEDQQRIDCLVLWQESAFFNETECAALAWAEALTDIATTRAPDHAYEALQRHYSEQQIVDLTLIISTMNLWNRLAISMRRLPERRS